MTLALRAEGGGSVGEGSTSLTSHHTSKDWKCGDLTCDSEHDPVPEGTNRGVLDTGLGLKMVDGKLTGNITWGCSTAQMASCAKAIESFDDLINTNSSFLNITNTLVDNTDPKVETTANMRFHNNTKSTEGGHWDQERKLLRVNSATQSPNSFKHEFGHAIGLPHMKNETKNFMSYYGNGFNRNVTDRSYKLTGSQKYGLSQVYKASSSWWPF